MSSTLETLLATNAVPDSLHDGRRPVRCHKSESATSLAPPSLFAFKVSNHKLWLERLTLCSAKNPGGSTEREEERPNRRG